MHDDFLSLLSLVEVVVVVVEVVVTAAGTVVLTIKMCHYFNMSMKSVPRLPT